MSLVGSPSLSYRCALPLCMSIKTAVILQRISDSSNSSDRERKHHINSLYIPSPSFGLFHCHASSHPYHQADIQRRDARLFGHVSRDNEVPRLRISWGEALILRHAVTRQVPKGVKGVALVMRRCVLVSPCRAWSSIPLFINI